jgi:hypothetical protein
MPRKSIEQPPVEDTAAWYATAQGRRATEREFRRALKDGTLKLNPHGLAVEKPSKRILEELAEKARQKITRLVTLRLPVVDVERAGRLAGERGETVSAVLREALHRGLERSRKSGRPRREIMRGEPERARQARGKRWAHLAGDLEDEPRDLSTRKGFSRK